MPLLHSSIHPYHRDTRQYTFRDCGTFQIRFQGISVVDKKSALTVSQTAEDAGYELSAKSKKWIPVSSGAENRTPCKLAGLRITKTSIQKYLYNTSENPLQTKNSRLKPRNLPSPAPRLSLLDPSCIFMYSLASLIQ
jgi:hypothetical protein